MGGKSSKPKGVKGSSSGPSSAPDVDVGDFIAGAPAVALPSNATEYEQFMGSRLVAPADLSGDTALAALAVGSSSACTRRVMKEIREMRANLPVSVGSTTFVRYDRKRPYLMKVLIIGPQNTPYEGGAFVFDVACGSTYPKTAPKVLLRTTGGGSVRFNPNLYNCGKVCLSLLGTWSGTGCEQWQSGKSTLLQVLVSITGLIMVELPWYNEPGRGRPTPAALTNTRVRNDGNGGLAVIRAGTIQWACADAVCNPCKAFEDVIRAHFVFRKAHILRTYCEWLADSHKHKDTIVAKIETALTRATNVLEALPDNVEDLGSFIAPPAGAAPAAGAGSAAAAAGAGAGAGAAAGAGAGAAAGAGGAASASPTNSKTEAPASPDDHTATAELKAVMLKELSTVTSGPASGSAPSGGEPAAAVVLGRSRRKSKSAFKPTSAARVDQAVVAGTTPPPLLRTASA